MLAAVTVGASAMEVKEVPEPGPPGHGQVLVRPEAVGLCGSDYHFFDGTLTAEAGGGSLPRIQGHEVGALVEAVGPGCDPGLEPGRRVALYPLSACGRCYPCRIGRPNACVNFELIGIHVDGGLQERLVLPGSQAFPIDVSSRVAALAEPASIAIRAVHRARVAEGERVVVLGGGPIGQTIAIAAQDRGAAVLVVDLVESRVALSRELGADAAPWTDAGQVAERVAEWAGQDGPPVVFDATGAPSAVRAAVDMVAAGGRVAIVGMSGAEVSLRIGSFTEKELDVVGVCCCQPGEFADAVSLVERNAARLERLISHEFELARAPDALAYAMEHPTEVMKVVVV